MNENLEIIKLRFGKAKKAFRQIDVLIDNQFYDIVVNRIYYACFYSATAALLNIDIKAYTHKGVQQMFSLHFIKREKYPRKRVILFEKHSFCGSLAITMIMLL